jgi:hypothetical protein
MTDFLAIFHSREDTQRSQLKKEDALTTTYVRIRGDIQQQQQPKQQFPQQNILTPDDGRIGRNML